MIVSLLSNMMILAYGDENQELQRSIKSDLFSANFVSVGTQIRLIQKLRNIKMNALEFGFMKSGNLKSLRI